MQPLVFNFYWCDVRGNMLAYQNRPIAKNTVDGVCRFGTQPTKQQVELLAKGAHVFKRRDFVVG